MKPNGCSSDTGPEHVAGGCLLACMVSLMFLAGVIVLVSKLMGGGA